MKKFNNDGFTIVELLIVIVIIGILATIGFISFANAQNKAKKSKAQSVLSQVKSKLGEYSADEANSGKFPINKDAVEAYLSGAGNSDALATDFSDGGYTYAATPADCDNSATACSGFTITAADTIWGSNPSGAITVSN